MGQLEASDSEDAPEVRNPTFYQLIVEMVRNHPRILVLVILGRMYSNSFWYINLYILQKNQVNDSGSSSIFWNGFYFSVIDALSLLFGGMIGRHFNVFNSYLVLIGVVGVLTLVNLFTQSIIITYLLVLLIGMSFCLYFVIHMKSIPDKFHFVSLETAASVSALLT